MKIPFDIKYRPQIESGEYKVETRDGKPTRIVCWDLKGNEDFFILALVEKNEKEVSYCYPATGCCKAACDPEGKDDLFLVTPEPELSEFEDRLRIICENAVKEAHLFPHRTSEDFAKKHSAELLDLARKELQEQVIHDYWKQAADRCVQAREEGKAEALKEIEQDPESSYAFKRGFEYGKEEALKDLPKWRYKKSGTTGLILHDCLVLNKYGCVGKSPSGALLGDVWTLEYDELTKLPKLPKED